MGDTDMRDSAELVADVVLVPVPKHLLGAVYLLLGREMESQSNRLRVDAFPDRPAQRECADTTWTEEELRRLKGLITTAVPRAVLDRVSEKVGSRVSFDEACRLAERTPIQGRGELSGFTKLVSKHFPGKPWPFEVAWLPGGRAEYLCQSECVARWWRAD